MIEIAMHLIRGQIRIDEEITKVEEVFGEDHPLLQHGKLRLLANESLGNGSVQLRH